MARHESAGRRSSSTERLNGQRAGNRLRGLKDSSTIHIMKAFGLNFVGERFPTCS